MPKNNHLKPAKLPMVDRFDEDPTTKFINNLMSIDIKLIEGPDIETLRSYLPQFLEATWAENPDDAANLTLKEKDNIIRECLQGRALPTALETIQFVFRIDGISLQEVTHIIRHRTASFSADCSGDKWWTHKDALVPNSIQNSPEHYEEYQEIVKASKKLYVDMINTRKISIMDARYILPRCLSTFYFMRMNLKDLIGFIRQRIDKQIQPETDNLMAYYMYEELLKSIPLANGLIDIRQPSHFFMKMARTGKATNLYFPDEDSDGFDYHEDDFIYKCPRSEMTGTDSNHYLFGDFLKEAEERIRDIEIENSKQLALDYFNEATEKAGLEDA